MLRKIAWVILALILAGCAAKTPGFEEKLAEQTAVAFYKALAAGHYADADKLFAGDYAPLASLTTAVSPEDHIGLWKNACELSGMQCLAIDRIISTVRVPVTEQNPQTAFKITVEFKDKTGKLLVQGPCCGASATEMPPVSQFTMDVVERGGKFYVTSLPVLTP
jgi:hypothetical protein